MEGYLEIKESAKVICIARLLQMLEYIAKVVLLGNLSALIIVQASCNEALVVFIS